MSLPPARHRLLLLLALAAACRGEEGGAGTGGGGRDGKGGGTTDSADGGIAIVTRTAYTPAPLAQMGGIEGVVRLDGAAPADSTHQVGRDSARCGARVVERAVQQQGGGLGEAVVWLDDVRSGKPHPELRRIELSHERCQYAPRVQVTSAPSTLNVLNDDRAVHVTTVTHVGASKPVVSIPFTDDGQVVPTELAARTSGVVEVRCAQHPWATAYIASFDHPYYALTSTDGRFRLDSVPPGRYTIKVWHPRGRQVVSQPVQVGAGGAVTVEAGMAVK